jgi:hygromycin-B 4-O-kinase
LGAGQWSRAFSFDTDSRPLVIRFGDQDEDFEKDRIAASWQQPGLPVPKFIDMGEAFGTFYAITERAEGRFLDHLTRNEVAEVLPSLMGVLHAQRRIPVAQAAGFGGWDRNGMAEHSSWKSALLAVATERPRIAGWKRRLQKWPECERAFHQGFERLQILAEHVPSRQDVIHSDLLNRNVLGDRCKRHGSVRLGLLYVRRPPVRHCLVDVLCAVHIRLRSTGNTAFGATALCR